MACRRQHDLQEATWPAGVMGEHVRVPGEL